PRAEITENTTATLVGVAATGVGLLAGWFAPVERLRVGTGFRLGGVWVEVARAVLATARGPVLRVDEMLYAGTCVPGRIGVRLAWIFGQVDERGIDALIAQLVGTLGELGG